MAEEILYGYCIDDICTGDSVKDTTEISRNFDVWRNIIDYVFDNEIWFLRKECSIEKESMSFTNITTVVDCLAKTILKNKLNCLKSYFRLASLFSTNYLKSASDIRFFPSKLGGQPHWLVPSNLYNIKENIEEHNRLFNVFDVLPYDIGLVRTVCESPYIHTSDMSDSLNNLTLKTANDHRSFHKDELNTHNYTDSIAECNNSLFLNQGTSMLFQHLKCPICNECLTFLLQIYAPQETIINNQDVAFHRYIYVFICIDCNGDVVVALRCQLPRENLFFSSHPFSKDSTVDEQSTNLQFSNSSHGYYLSHFFPLFLVQKDTLPADQTSHHFHESPQNIVSGNKSETSSISLKLPFFLANILHCCIICGCPSPLGSFSSKFFKRFAERNGLRDIECEEIFRAGTIHLRCQIAFEYGCTAYTFDEKVIEIESESANSSASEDESDEEEVDHDEDERCYESFIKKISGSNRIIRYSYGGSPLWLRKSDSAILNLDKETTMCSRVPNCENCGGTRIFEFQLLPGVLDYIKNDNVNIGTVCIFVCNNNCISAGDAYIKEYVHIQKDTSLLSRERYPS